MRSWMAHSVKRRVSRPCCTCKYALFRSGAEGIRTPDLRRAKADLHILACPNASGYSAILQVFYTVLDDSSSGTY